MRRISFCALLHLMFLLAVPLFYLQGCASHMQTYPASEQETQLTVSAFTRFSETYQDKCACCLDAEVDVAVSVSGWFSDHTGKFSGYLQAMEPGYIKFVALNPLGQPILILLTDGSIFKSLNILEGKAYIGSVNSETFRKFAPSGFDPELSYYWLTGRVPPGEVEILEVRRDKEQKGYWLHVKYGQSEIDNMVLFDPEDFVIRRRIVMNDRGNYMLDLEYGNYQPGHGKIKEPGERDKGMNESADPGVQLCKMPTSISVTSNAGADKKVDLKLFSFIPAAEFSPDDFVLEIPANLEQLIVN